MKYYQKTLQGRFRNLINPKDNNNNNHHNHIVIPIILRKCIVRLCFTEPLRGAQSARPPQARRRWSLEFRRDKKSTLSAPNLPRRCLGGSKKRAVIIT